jgi:UDP-N-acetylmuramoyl-tripeptide--D-alanyl-D-alanine ligase
MSLWSAQEAALATGGETAGDWQAEGVSIDTRTLQAGDLFVALADQRDGHDFVAEALQKGASAALVSRRPADVLSDENLLYVQDVQAALEGLARAARQRSAAQVIAITGSAGKTSTKEMLRVMLQARGKTHASYASYNNHWGVPLTLASLPRDAAFAVVEIGMSNPGEIAPLARLVRPDAALITTVAPAHLAAFENLKGIAREKAAIVQGLTAQGYAVLNAEAPCRSVMEQAFAAKGCQSHWFGSGAAQARITQLSVKDGLMQVMASIGDLSLKFELHTVGRHFAMNALGALALLSKLNADVEKAARVLAQWQPTEGRGMRHQLHASFGAVELIDDAYNANPVSMQAALDVLAQATSSRRVAFLGDMKELGADERAHHSALAQLPAIRNIDLIHTAGPLMAALHHSLPVEKRGQHFANAKEMAACVEDLLQADDCILVKASLSSGLRQVVDAIKIISQSDPDCAARPVERKR